MKNLSFNIYNAGSLFSIVLIILLILLPFNLINMEQAERIAKWKSEYENLKYCFSLVNLHEGSIIPTNEELTKIVSESEIWNRIIPYLNVKSVDFFSDKEYKYRTINGRPIKKTSQFYFDKFLKLNNGVVIGIKENQSKETMQNVPLYYLLVDINGIEKPNRIGQDIFFTGIYKDSIKALGRGESTSNLKANCSPIGNGLYCSEYYLKGGRF